MRCEQYFPGFLCYPEGTRNIKPHSLPLRRGMLRYAHSKASRSNHHLCGKEKVLSQKRLAAVTRVTVAYSLIHSDSYPVFEDFAEAIRHSWADEWASAYNHESKMEKLKDFEPSERTIRYERWVDVFTVGTVISFFVFCALVAHALQIIFPKIIELGHA